MSVEERPTKGAREPDGERHAATRGRDGAEVLDGLDVIEGPDGIDGIDGIEGVRAVRPGPGGNCSSAGSTLDLLFAGAAVAGAIVAAVAAVVRERAAPTKSAPPPTKPHEAEADPSSEHGSGDSSDSSDSGTSSSSSSGSGNARPGGMGTSGGLRGCPPRCACFGSGARCGFFFFAMARAERTRAPRTPRKHIASE